MPSVFLVSDSHFTHQGVCRFTRDDGFTKLRPWDNVEDMDRDMIEYWNDTVKPTDKVYHLGDVVINRKALAIMPKLHGDKVLIRGNHDIFKLSDYTPHFRDIRAYHVMNGLILSHVPIHPDSLGRFGCNIHGHLHANRVKLADGSIDPRYYNVCVEQTNFRPILFEEVQKRIVEQGGKVGTWNGNN